MCREEPLALVVYGEGVDEILLFVGLQSIKGGRHWSIQGCWSVDYKGVIIVLQVVDCCMLWRGDVDAHRDSIDELGYCVDCWKGGYLAAYWALDLLVPGCNRLVFSHVGVVVVIDCNHLRDEVMDCVPHE